MSKRMRMSKRMVSGRGLGRDEGMRGGGEGEEVEELEEDEGSRQ